MNDRREVPLGDVLEMLIDYRGKTPPKSDTGVKLITAKVIKDGRIDRSRLEYISEATYEAWMRRGLPRKGDILVTTEAPLGEVAQLRWVQVVCSG
jgi:type I restriction enzyme S subunit